LFKAYAILEVGVPNEVVGAVGEQDADTMQSLMVDNYLGGLLREEGEGKRIYHAILADYILEQISEDERKAYHGRAVGIYRGKLEKAEKEKIRPDALAAIRLAEHVLVAQGKEAFVDAVLNESGEVLMNLGLLDIVENSLLRTLEKVRAGSNEEAMVTGNLGLIYRVRGELDKAEEMHLKSLKIEKKLGRLEGMAKQYGNLGLVYYTRGDLNKAKEMYEKSLEIEKKLGQLEGMASQYGNLGNVYEARGDLDKAEEMLLKSL